MIDKIKAKIRNWIRPESRFYKMLNVKSARRQFGIFNFFTNEYALGPIQKDEAIFLFGLIKVLRPRVIVEFGFAKGFSSGLFVAASDPQTLIYSYDISESSGRIAERYFSNFPNFRFIKKSQLDFKSGDISNQAIDLVFIDGAHDLEINQQTFKAIYPVLKEGARIVVHDTGLWCKKFMLADHFEVLKNAKHKWIDDERVAHQIDERMFVNWIVETYHDFTFIDFETDKALRHGLTILCREKKLIT